MKRSRLRQARNWAAAVLGATALVLLTTASGRTPAAVSCFGQVATIAGTNGPDTLTGTNGPDVIAGLGGNDRINGLGGDDFICGGPGNDQINGGDGSDLLFGEEGADQIDSGPGQLDAVIGGPGNDVLTGNQFAVVVYLDAVAGVRVDLSKGTATGGAGTDTLKGFNFVFGSAYDDTIIGNANLNAFFATGGNDTLDGRGGFDLVGFAIQSSVVASLANGLSFGEGDDKLIRMEGLFAGNGNDRLTGDGRDNFLSGNVGNDVIQGGGGADTVFGGAGDDQLSGGPGTDFIDPGPGANVVDGGAGANDQVTYADFFSATAAGVSVDLAAGTGRAAGLSDTLRGVESVVGSDYNDVLAGDDAGNSLIAGGGDDTLSGRGGNDFLNGGPGTDTADGGPGNLDYCLDTEPTVNCELTAKTPAIKFRRLETRARALRTLVLRICGHSLCRERVRVPSGASAVGAVPVASLADSYTEPTCRRVRGGGVTTIAPPKRIRQPGSNGTAQWRAVLYRQGSGRPLAKTPLAEGQLVSPANPSPGVPAAWTNPKTHKIVTKKTVRVRKPGIYYWQASVTLVKLGPAGSGRMQAYFDPPGSASARPYCDFH